MNITTRRVGSDLLLGLQGPLTVEADTHQVTDMVPAMLQRDVKRVVVDLAEVSRLDCSGLGQLVRLRNQVRQSGSALILINVERRAKRLFELAGLLGLIPVFDSWHQAMMWREADTSRGRSIATEPPVCRRSRSITRFLASSPCSTRTGFRNAR